MVTLKLLVYGIAVAMVSSTAFSFCERVRIKKESVCDVVDVFNRSKYVFIGTVAGKLTFGARMHVDSAFKGTPGETIEVGQDPMCYAGPSLEEGKQYLIYAFTYSEGRVAEIGERSCRIEDADADLQFINRLVSGKTLGYIGGRVRRLPEDWIDSAGYRLLYDKGHIDENQYKPIGNVLVKVKNSKVEFSTVTDEKGQYAIFDLPSDIYYIEPMIGGYAVKVAPEYVWLPESGCAEANLLLQANH
jgi:hypothetical protein